MISASEGKQKRRWVAFLLWGLLLVLLALSWGCYPRVPREEIKQVPEQRAEEVASRLDPAAQGLEDWSELRPGLERNLEHVRARMAENATSPEIMDMEVSWEELERTLQRLIALLPRLQEEGAPLLAEHFRIYRLRPDPLFTGYFEPQIRASPTRRPGYETPIYGVPSDLKTADLGRFHPRWQGQELVYRIEGEGIEPYPSRRQIRNDPQFSDKAPVLAWVKHPLELFILQIQGSGKLLLPGGEIRHLGYAGKNGRQYRSLGRVLRNMGYLENSDTDLQSIEKFLASRPDLMPDILDVNPSYVFFRKREEGPFGAMNAQLEPLLSLAVDPELIPLGAPLLYRVGLPEARSQDRLEMSGLGLAQDVGGAVKGHHLDLFFGSGEEARYRASHMKDKGSLYILLAK